MNVIEVDGLDATAEVLSEQYTSMRLAPSDGGRSLRIEQHELDAVRLHRLGFGLRAELDGDPLGVVSIGQVRSGRVTYHHADHDVQCERGDVVLASRPDEAWRATLRDLHGDFILLDPAALSDVAQPEHPGRPVRFTGYTPTAPSAARRWNETFEYVLGLAAEPEAGALVAAAGARLLMATALVTIPNDALLEPTATDRRDGHSETLRRAVAFIDANPHRPVTTTDIARAAHVTIRAVQFAFRRQLDTTPMAYLRRVRLDGARADLRAGTPATTTVVAVSMRWGFSSASQFAARYKTAHGESPSATLQR